MTPGIIWILAGLAACGAEMLVLPTGGYLLWVGVAAAGAGLLTEALGLAFAGTAAAFVVLVAALLAITRLRPRAAPIVNVADDGLVGQACRALVFRGSEGRVQIGDGAWQARDVDGAQPALDAALRVVGRTGTVLLVSADVSRG